MEAEIENITSSSNDEGDKDLSNIKVEIFNMNKNVSRTGSAEVMCAPCSYLQYSFRHYNFACTDNEDSATCFLGRIVDSNFILWLRVIDIQFTSSNSVEKVLKDLNSGGCQSYFSNFL